MPQHPLTLTVLSHQLIMSSAAATGFVSSASDLSKLVLELLHEKNSPLEVETLRSMREPHGFLLGSGIWGLGTILYVKASHGDFVFGHDGAMIPPSIPLCVLIPQPPMVLLC